MQRNNNRIISLNIERKISSLRKKANNHAQLLWVIEKEEMPNLSALITIRLRNGEVLNHLSTNA